jgi:acyl-CoA dehydrogenase
MNFEHSPRTQELLARLSSFQEREVAPREEPYLRELLSRPDPWVVLPVIEELKAKARSEGLWNLFLPDEQRGAGLSNVQYAPLAERMGRSLITAEVCNCNAPDSGNMEVLWHFGSEEQKQRWLEPLLAGEIRSAFCMTEPGVASSDATNMQATAVPDGEEVVLNGLKWWSSGVGHPNCEVGIFMGLTDPSAHRYRQHSMVLVPLATPGVKVERSRTDRRRAHRDRPGPPARAARRLAARRGLARRDGGGLPDQGCGADHDSTRRRHGNPTARRRRVEQRSAARRRLDRRSRPAAGRRPR